jgi:hypothetical protein
LKRRTSINSPTQFHKEKEMADFRKWFLALAVVALLSSFAAPAFAQAVTCAASAGVPPVIRSEGVAEEVGDVVLNCTGAATPGSINVQIFLNAFVTSKLTANGLSDALLLLNEPSGAEGASNPICLKGSCDGTPNAFQGQLQNLQTSASGVTGYTSIVWTGIPFTPPGTGTAVIRITNVRSDALSATPAVGQFIPQTIQEFVAINGVSGVAINPSQLTVAYLQPGILLGTTGNVPALICQGHNTGLLSGGDGIAEVTDFAGAVTEGFASSFKIKGTGEQSTPGTNYFTESGFTSGLLPSDVGTATNATRFFVNITGLVSGVSVFLPTSIPLYRSSDGAVTGAAQLVTCDSTGATCTFASTSGATTPLSVATAAFTGSAVHALNTFYSGGAIPLSSVSVTGPIFYEVTADDPFTVETAAVPISFAFGPGLPISSGPSPTISVGLAPQNTDVMALATDPIPRFGPSSAPASSLGFTVGLCQCNLLFPYVTSRANFDTGIAVSNTSTDPWNSPGTPGGTVQQHGTITYHFYGDVLGIGGGPAVALTSAQQMGTSADVASGTTYAFSIYSGDTSNGAAINGIVGFQGYVIATANFQYCHGYAFISGFGRGAYDQGASEGYLGLVMDKPIGFRLTGTSSEILGQ